MKEYSWLIPLIRYLGLVTVADYMSDLSVAFVNYLEKGDVTQPFEYLISPVEGQEDLKCGIKIECNSGTAKITTKCFIPQDDVLVAFQIGAYLNKPSITFSTPENSVIRGGVIPIHVLQFEAHCQK